MANGNLRHGGEGAMEWYMIVLDFLLGIFFGLMAIGGTVLFIGIDIALGPNLLFSFTSLLHANLNSVEKIVPWLISVATSGLLYAVWRLPEIGSYGNNGDFFKKWAQLIALVDSVIDALGCNVWLEHDPQAALSPGYWWHENHVHLAISVAAGVLCYFHERFLGKVLRWDKDRLSKNGMTTAGTKVEFFLANLAGWILSIVVVLSIYVGVISMIGLGFILIPVAGGKGNERWAFVVASAVLTFGSTMFWRYFSHVDVGLSMNNLKNAFAKAPEYLSVQGMNKARQQYKDMQGDQRILLFAFLAIVAASLFDLGGLNKILFGKASLFPAHMSLIWGLTAFLVVSLTAADTAFANYVFRPISLTRQVRLANIRGGVELVVTEDVYDDYGGFGGSMPGDGGGFGGPMPPPRPGTPPPPGGSPPPGSGPNPYGGM